MSCGSPPAGCGGMRSLGRAELQFVGFVPCPIAAINPIAPPGVSAPLCASAQAAPKCARSKTKQTPALGQLSTPGSAVFPGGTDLSGS